MKDPLSVAHRAARYSCGLLYRFARGLLRYSGDRAEQYYRSALRDLKDTLDSLYTRAKQGPQLLATWGPAAFLVFIASKAADLAEEEQQLELFDNVILSSVRQECLHDPLPIAVSGSRPSVNPTALGYAVYLSTVMRISYLLGWKPFTDCDSVRLVDDLVNAYLEGEIPASQLLYSVENTARLLQLYLLPMTSRMDKLRREGLSPKEVIEKLAQRLEMITQDV